MAAAMTGAGLTEGGQTAAPKETRALEVAGEADFMARIEEAESAAAAGRVRPAEDRSAGLRERRWVKWALRPGPQPFEDDLDAARRTPPRRSR